MLFTLYSSNDDDDDDEDGWMDGLDIPLLLVICDGSDSSIIFHFPLFSKRTSYFSTLPTVHPSVRPSV